MLRDPGALRRAMMGPPLRGYRASHLTPDALRNGIIDRKLRIPEPERMGDERIVLAGHIGFCGAYLHGLSGELARENLGVTSVTAGDLVGLLPLAIREVAG